MAINQLNENMSIISELSDEPNAVDGLTSSELKAKFDAAGMIIKEYVNNSLIPDVEAEIVKSVDETVIKAGNMPSGGTAGQALVKASDEPYDWAFSTVNALPPGGSPGQVLTKQSEVDGDAGFATIPAIDWTLEASFETAGTHTWTAPDPYGNGQPYKVGARVIGGGGGGGAFSANNTGGDSPYTWVAATGGASGYARCAVVTVTPGTQYSVVVGAGGAATARSATSVSSSVTPTRIEGKAGGTSSFAGITANGGSGGWGGYGQALNNTLHSEQYSTAPLAASGGQGSDAPDLRCGDATNNQFRTWRTMAPYMGQPTFSAIPFNLPGGMSDPASLYNPFENTFNELAAGGGAHAHRYSGTYYTQVQTGYTFANGKKAGNGAASAPSGTTGAPDVVAQSATSPGCGGGGAANRTTMQAKYATSGAGAPGAVYIYVRRAV